MQLLTSAELATFLFALGALLAVARLLGELAQRLRQPAVVGELLAGLLLGPTVLGRFAPELLAAHFPAAGAGAVALQTLTSFSIVLFLLVAGMEVDLSTVWRQGRVALAVSLAGISLPFTLGLAAAWIAPALLGRHPEADPLTFALFIATALSISALPVIVKILMDLHIYKSDLGMIVVGAAILNDLVGWIAFAVVLSMAGAAAAPSTSIGATIALTMVFVALVLTLGRWWVHRALLWIQAYTSGQGAVLGFALTLGLLGAACTEAMGIHAIFGAFLVGVAIGDSSRLRQRTRTVLAEFISFIFAPLFFASIGLRVDFLAHFHLPTVLTVLALACLGKLAGCSLGALATGLRAREALAIGAALNVRGAMEIILGLLALQSGVIHERTFVALVTMAFVTSLAGGPLIERLLKRHKARRLHDHLTQSAFVPALGGRTRREAISVLTRALADSSALDHARIEAAVWAREELVPTGLGHGIAVPHARLAGLRAPLLAVGLSREGIDFNSPDGQPAHLIFLLLTPSEENTTQLELLADIARTFRDEPARARALESTSFLEFVAAVQEARPTGNEGSPAVGPRRELGVDQR